MKLPQRVIHGTTKTGVLNIQTHGIQTRGYNAFGFQSQPKSLDFGEGFYCTLDNKMCRESVTSLATTRAAQQKCSPRVINIYVDEQIHQDQNLRWLVFDGRRSVDGLEWAGFIAHHRVNKELSQCNQPPCTDHPDIIIGPVADGNLLPVLSQKFLSGIVSIDDYYKEITKPRWFPHYVQIVFGRKALKYLSTR